jgi:hypothetical protein
MYEELLAELEEDFPSTRRRWNVTIFRNEVVENGIKNVVVREYRNVRPQSISGEILGYDGVLRFVDESGKAVVVSSLPFLATEVDRAPAQTVEEPKQAACIQPQG